MSYPRFTPIRFLRRTIAAALLGLLCHMHGLYAVAQTRNDLDPDSPLETLDTLAREAADLVLTRQGLEEPEEGPDPAPHVTRFSMPRALSQVPAQMATVEQASPAQESSGTSSPIEILRQAKRVYIPSQGPPVTMPDSSPQELPQATPDSIPTSPQPDVSRSQEEATPKPGKKPGLVKRVIRAVPFIGSHIINDRPAPPPTEAEAEQGRLDRVELDRDILAQTSTSTLASAPILYPAPGDAITSDIPVTSLNPSIETSPSSAETLAKAPALETAPTPLIIADSTAEAPVQIPAMATLTPTITVQINDPRMAAPPAASTPLPVRPVVRSAAPAMPSSFVIPTPLPAATAASAHLMTPSAAPDPTVPRPAWTIQTASVAGARTSTTSPTLEENDLAMPNPAVEENQLVRDEFAAAIKEARAGNFVHAAEMLHTYGTSHPSSRLTPRAIFLSVLLFPEAVWRESAEQELTTRYSKSPYDREWNRRKAAMQPKPSDLYSLMGQLEQELASDPAGPSALDKCCKLAALFVKQENFDRAFQVLAPYMESSKGQPQEPEVLDLLSECRIAQGQNAAAMNLLADLLQRFPNYPGRSRVRLNMGLVNEAEGNYQRAAAEYRKLREEAPDTPEARMAGERISDLHKLSE